MQQIIQVVPLRNVRTLTKWLKQTKHLLTTVGKIKAFTLSVFYIN
ncbi:hypothetical protein MPC1_17980002 [Methylocella tundrae]|nr:hypothetical protein MPC1_17980002 [Methylocella tundrae]